MVVYIVHPGVWIDRVEMSHRCDRRDTLKRQDYWNGQGQWHGRPRALPRGKASIRGRYKIPIAGQHRNQMSRENNECESEHRFKNAPPGGGEKSSARCCIFETMFRLGPLYTTNPIYSW